MLQKKYTVLKSEHQVRLISDSYAQVIAVTTKHTLQLRAMTYFLVWQLRSIRRNFLFPISAISHPAAAVSHTQKINRSNDSLRAHVWGGWGLGGAAASLPGFAVKTVRLGCGVAAPPWLDPYLKHLDIFLCTWQCVDMASRFLYWFLLFFSLNLFFPLHFYLCLSFTLFTLYHCYM